MAHIGQELALGLISRFGSFLGIVQLLFCPLSLSHVSNHLGRADHVAVGILYRRYRDGAVEWPLALSETNGFEMIDAFAAPDAREHLQFLLLMIRRNQSHDRRADHFVGAVSEDALRSEIPISDDTV